MSFAAEWARCGAWLEAALAHAGGTHGLADVEAMVLRGEARFWAGRAAAAVAVLEQDPRESRVLIWLAGGTREELENEILPQVEAWARVRAVRRVLIIGRAGWERTLKAKGYAPLARLIAKEL